MAGRRGHFGTSLLPFGNGMLNIDDVYRLPGTNAPSPTPTVPATGPRPRNPRSPNLRVIGPRPAMPRSPNTPRQLRPKPVLKPRVKPPANRKITTQGR